MRQEFFSLLANGALLADRLAKECVHDLGHYYGSFHCKECVHDLGHYYGSFHCNDARCIMFFSNNIISMDNKVKDFCPNCHNFFNLKARKENND